MDNDKSAFGHYLITQFNVPVSGWSADKTGTVTRDPAWMQHRLRLFADFCKPTVAGQSLKNFRWLIWLDPHTPDADLVFIRSLIRDIQDAEIHFAASQADLAQQLRAMLAADPSPFVITSRLDNDDGLSPQYIRTIQASFQPVDKLLLNITGGLLYDVHRKVLTRLRLLRLNHFTSLVEANHHDGKLLTVIGFPHHTPPANVRVQDISEPYGWLKIVHERNVSSRTKGIPLLAIPVEASFPVPVGLMPVSAWHTACYAASRLISVVGDRLGFRRHR